MRWKLEHNNGEIIKTKNKKKTAEETLQCAIGTTTSAKGVQWRRYLTHPNVQGYHCEPGAEAITHLNYSIFSSVASAALHCVGLISNQKNIKIKV